MDEGLWFKKGVDTDLVVFSDSSYGPSGSDSQGTVIVQWAGGLVMWKAGRQSVPALSTAESELQEAIEGLVMGDSVDVLVQELIDSSYVKVVKIDNQAAASLISEPAGSWRTRHLRLRAAHLRWRIQRADWLTEAIPGGEQLADVVTKVMTAPKLEEMRKMLGMSQMEHQEGGAEVELEKDHGVGSRDREVEDAEHGEERVVVSQAAEMIQLAVMMGSITQAYAQDESAGDSDWWLVGLVCLFAIIGVISCLCWLYRGCGRWSKWLRRILSVRRVKELREKAEATGRKSREHRRLQRRDPDARGSDRAAGSEQVGVSSPPEEVRGVNDDLVETAVSVQRARREEKITALVTPCGARWRASLRCPTLASTRDMRVLKWCERCGADVKFAGDIFLEKHGAEVAYRDVNCLKLTKDVLAYPACKMCPTSSRRSTA